MRKNGDTGMYYVSFGSGSKNPVVLPGLSDGPAAAKGEAWILSFPYKKFFRDYTVYMFSRKNKMPFQAGEIWQSAKSRQRSPARL